MKILSWREIDCCIITKRIRKTVLDGKQTSKVYEKIRFWQRTYVVPHSTTAWDINVRKYLFFTGFFSNNNVFLCSIVIAMNSMVYNINGFFFFFKCSRRFKWGRKPGFNSVKALQGRNRRGWTDRPNVKSTVFTAPVIGPRGK